MKTLSQPPLFSHAHIVCPLHLHIRTLWPPVSNGGGALRLWSATDGLLLWEAPASSASASAFLQHGIDFDSDSNSDSKSDSNADSNTCHDATGALDAAPSSGVRLSDGERDLSVPLRAAAARARKLKCRGYCTLKGWMKTQNSQQKSTHAQKPFIISLSLSMIADACFVMS